MSPPSDTPRCTRALPGITSAIRLDWKGIPLDGLYLIESQPIHAHKPPTRALPPVILLPAVFDPLRGEYSPQLPMSLFQWGFSHVVEAHYNHEDQHGWLEPRAVVRDIEMICRNAGSPPVLVGFCGGVPCLLESLLRIARSSLRSSVAGALLIAPHIPDHNNLYGWFTQYYLLHPRRRARKIGARWSGHGHLTDNVRRVVEWYSRSEVKNALATGNWDLDSPDAFPIRVSTLYFDHDILSLCGRQALARVFSAEQLHGRIPGWHGTLRRIPGGNTLIADFCAASAGIAPVSGGMSA